MPSHMCAGCGTKNFKAEFSEAQWRRQHGKRYCKNCEKILSCQGERKQCRWCGQWHTEDMFDDRAWRQKRVEELWCKNCQEQRQCKGTCAPDGQSGLYKTRKEFATDAEWEHAARPHSERGKCTKCMQKNRPFKPCSVCGQEFPNKLEFFSKWMWLETDAKRKCKTCSQASCSSAVEKRLCNACKAEKTRTFFSDQQWHRVGKTNRKCIECCVGSRSPSKIGQWTCKAAGCGFTGDKEQFRYWREKQNTDKANGRQKCNRCFLALDPDLQNLAIRRRDVQKHTRILESNTTNQKKRKD